MNLNQQIKARAFLITDRENMSSHVGVKRLVNYITKSLSDIGIECDYGNYENQKFRIINSQSCSYLSTNQLKYDYIFITAPWIITENFPELQNSIGIVYDIAPNLISIGALRLPGNYLDTHYFGYLHSIGYTYYAKVCRKIIAISNHTKNDFQLLTKRNQEVHSILPFMFSKEQPWTSKKTKNILIVNSFDQRKNVFKIFETLLLLADQMEPNFLTVTLIGSPRMHVSDLQVKMDLLKKRGVHLEWLGVVSDLQLFEAYQNAKVVFCPSAYEGLGYVVLEAQCCLTPVVSSNSSSLKEINVFPELTGEWDDIDFFSKILKKILEDEWTCSVDNLKERLNKLFVSYKSLRDVLECGDNIARI